jgi:hypothetical protein
VTKFRKEQTDGEMPTDLLGKAHTESFTKRTGPTTEQKNHKAITNVCSIQKIKIRTLAV